MFTISISRSVLLKTSIAYAAKLPLLRVKLHSTALIAFHSLFKLILVSAQESSYACAPAVAWRTHICTAMDGVLRYGRNVWCGKNTRAEGERALPSASETVE